MFSLTKQQLIQNPDTNFVITDVRFPNEAKMILETGGQVWRVKRGLDPMWFRVYQDIGVEPKDVHPSEWAWANTHFDVIIEKLYILYVQEVVAPIYIITYYIKW